MTVSLVVVNYRASAALGRMLETVEDVDEVIVVDHSEDPAETEALEDLGVDRVVPQANGGYGAGLNRGVREARGEVLLLANPDLRLRPGTVEALVGSLGMPDVGIAAPRLFWDEALRWAVPQAPDVRWWRELEWKYSPRTARRRYLRRQLELWDAVEPVRTPIVSGTVMAVRREVFRDAGGFDPKYFLFYEENDFCMRVSRLGLSPVVVPSAVVVHEIGVSADAGAAEHFRPSFERYRRLWMPAWFTMVWPDPVEPAISRPGTVRPDRAGEHARWVIVPDERFVPVVRGPLVGDADPSDPDFLPSEATRNWIVGILEGTRIRMSKS